MTPIWTPNLAIMDLNLAHLGPNTTIWAILDINMAILDTKSASFGPNLATLDPQSVQFTYENSALPA